MKSSYWKIPPLQKRFLLLKELNYAIESQEGWCHLTNETGGNNIYDSCRRMYTIQRHKFLLNVINDIFFNRWFEEIWLVIWQRLDFKQTFNIFISFDFFAYTRIKWMSLMIFSGEKQLMHSSIKVNYWIPKLLLQTIWI